MTVAVETLKQVRFLQDIPEDYLAQIAEMAEIKEVPMGTMVFREGEKSSHIYLVLEGRVSLEIGVPGRGSVPILTVGSGELLGWSPMLGAGTMTATARALCGTRLIAMHGPQLVLLGEHNPRLGLELMRRAAMALANRLKATRLQLLDVFRQELPVFPEERGEG